ncbi:delta1-piperideine-2-carboxylate reductase [Mesorhizobium soli]|uniref:Ldh family oxidoreductase n=1 Tax=Pseudaminobacter soli (ex Li et al. 2025) TaxID=1295366 RepID=UPI002476826D|nr:Ldh family oxidoreductase [Mesorhizobium soli]MDH6233278.1 delta1-piperideine-2-carboxylate reductase [Mesorhizobium soli]
MNSRKIESDVRLSESDLMALTTDFLLSHGLNIPQAHSLARILVVAQRDGSWSHGLQRLPGTLDTMSHPRFNKAADPAPESVSAAAVRIDAQYGFSCLAAERGIDAMVEKTKQIGIGLLAVKNGFHSTALWPLIERIAEAGLVGLSMNPTHAWVAPAGGTKGLLGTNPLAFAWPRKDKPPYVFDFATSAASRADIAMHRNSGEEIPDNWGVNAQGERTTDPAEVLAGAMLPFGGHKGSAIATLIELMAGPLIGDRTSRLSQDFDQGANAAPCHGELLLAFSPDIIGGAHASDDAESVFAGFSDQGVRLPGDRRYRMREVSAREGIAVSSALLDRIRSLVR